jgi:hypothetical protein
MDILLNYNYDRNNGVSLIKDFTQYNVFRWGQPSCSEFYLCGPMCVISEGIWKILVYRDDPDVDQFIFYQLIDISAFCIGMDIRTSNTDITYTILNVLNPALHEVYVHTLNEFERYEMVQTISLPYSTSIDSNRISTYEQYLAVSDYLYDNGGGNYGRVFIYEWDPVINTYSLIDQVAGACGNCYFGYSIAIREGTLFVGVPYHTNAVARDGMVQIYDKVGSNWTMTQTIYGPAFTDGFYGWSLYAYLQTSTSRWRLIVGNPGANSAQGRIYFYNRIGGVWTLNTMITAPIGYIQNGNRFGYDVGILRENAITSAIGELAGQGVVYLYRYNGVTWSIAYKQGGVDIARYTTTGATEYGRYITMGQDLAGATFMLGIKPSYDLFNNTTANEWRQFTLLVADKMYIKNTVDHSFYHLASGNETIKFKLESPITGNYKVQLDMENALMTIGPQNCKVYFVEDNVYKIATLKYGNFTGSELALYVQERMNLVSTWSNNYTITYDAISNKFTVTAINPFAFGSNNPDSLKDSCQNKTMGFYDNHESVVHVIYGSDIEASLTAPKQIGVNILEGYPVIPCRNNCIFSEHGLRANLIGGRYKILASDNMYIHIPYKTTELTFVFPCLDGGALLRINTNDITARLTWTDLNKKEKNYYHHA